MSEPQTPPGAVPVTDHRPAPRGVLPRHVQTWVMAGIAIVMIGIILIAGRPDPVERPVTATVAPQTPNPDRVRDYQDRLRVVDTRAAYEAQANAVSTPAPSSFYQEPQTSAPEDPIVAERRRREYQSLFASNVVLSRRPDGQQPDANRAPNVADVAAPADSDSPSIDEIADAVVRATVRSGATTGPNGVEAVATPNVKQANTPAPSPTVGGRPENTAAIGGTGRLHRLLEGTVIDAVLTNRLDGSGTSPVNCLVTNPLYSHDRQHVLIPAGARVLGETKPVQAFGETRLAVAFHRLVLPDGRSVSLDRFLGTNQLGDAGLRDRVNQHYWSTFGAAAAVGLISGLAQSVGTAGFSAGTGDRTVVIAGSASDAAAQASAQVMNRFLNRFPTITIREGHRVKVYLTGDLELPAYEAGAPGRF